MKNFDSNFFSELTQLDFCDESNGERYITVPQKDGARLRASEHHAAGKLSDSMISLTRNFVLSLTTRSSGRYQFETDFCVFPYRLTSYSLGNSGRKQLHIGFDAVPASSQFHTDWGCSVGLAFDFRNHHGINPECVNEYEAFIEKVFCEPELFDSTFGHLGYAEPCEDFKDNVTAGKVMDYDVNILQHWLLFGRRFTPDAISAMGSLDEFVDECIRTFDVISESGF